MRRLAPSRLGSRTVLAAGALTAALVLAGCGGSSDEAAPAEPSAPPPAAPAPAPAESAPAPAPAESAPAAEPASPAPGPAPVESDPADATATEAPESETATESAPAETTPAESTPSESTPAETAPAETAPTETGAQERFTFLDGIPQEGSALGAPDAPVTLIEFADPQCPFCAQWATQAFPTVVDEYVRDGKVRIVFNGLAFIGPDSERARRVLAAASLQGHLWDLVELLYVNQGQENAGWVTDEFFRAIGAFVEGLDVDRLLEDADSKAVTQILAGWDQTTTQYGIDRTPAFVAGATDGELQPVELERLDAGGITPTLDELLGA
ncbi:MAG: thioredoxin domain-containing protein [Thermoleophilia bacterium]